MAENQSQHRQEIEKAVIQSDIDQSKRGLMAGLMIGLACVIGGCFLVYTGHDKAGAAIATGVVVALVSVFIYGTQSRRAERKDKTEVMAKAAKQ